MTDSISIFQKLGQWFQQTGTGNEPWRFIAALAVLIIGLIVLEILFQSVKRRVRQIIEAKGLSPDIWRLSAVLPPVRLACTAILLRASESFVNVPPGLGSLIHGLEGFILALAAIMIAFQLINLLGRLLETLPAPIQESLSESTVSKLKSALRISVLIIVAALFIYTQRDLFPLWLWQYAWWRYVLVFVIIYLTVLLIRLSDKFFSGMLIDLKDVEEKARQLFILRSTIWPIRLLLITIALYAFKEIIPLPLAFERISEHIISVLATLAVVVFLYRLVDLVAHELTRVAQREDNLLDQTFVQMIRYFARLIVGVVGAIFLIKALSGKPMSALLAGLGIGGLAVALAAQDTLKNFFGSIMIMLDKPFDVGQRVTVDGYDGTVENIGFRSTRVRTLTGHLVTVPNEKMASSNIENIGRRPSIRRLTNITITYDTPPDKVEKAVEIVRGILENHEGMHPDFLPRVYFNEFNSDSLNIIMLYWYHPPDYWKFLEFNERTNLQIMRAFEAEGIEFAFPTTTTYLAHDDRRPLHIQFSETTALSEPVNGQSVQPSQDQPETLS